MTLLLAPMIPAMSKPVVLINQTTLIATMVEPVQSIDAISNLVVCTTRQTANVKKISIVRAMETLVILLGAITVQDAVTTRTNPIKQNAITELTVMGKTPVMTRGNVYTAVTPAQQEQSVIIVVTNRLKPASHLQEQPVLMMEISALIINAMALESVLQPITPHLVTMERSVPQWILVVMEVAKAQAR